MIKRFLLLCLLLGFGENAFTQHTDAEQIYIDLESGFSIVENSFTEIWDPFPAGRFNLRVPFHAGELEAGVRYTRFMGNAPSEEDSDFHSIYINVGWNYPIHIFPRFQIAPTIRFGNNLMIFDESAVFVNNEGTERFVTDQMESEFAYELALRNQLSLSDNWHLNATFSYNRTLTFFPLPVTFFSIGITRSFGQPSWLKKFVE